MTLSFPSPWVVAMAAGLGAAATSVPRSPAVAQGDPGVPVRIVLDQARYVPGAHGQVNIRIGRDGYLVVLYAEPRGHVRVAFPVDPGDDAVVRAGTEVPIRSRGRPEAFTVEDSAGTGTWYAAISGRPFRFDSLALDGHWDYRLVPRVVDAADAERTLTAFVQRLATGRFDYDIVQFQIGAFAVGAAAPAPEPEGPWWAGPWAGPMVGPWPWPGPWLPRPWPGPGPFYDRAPGSGGHTAAAGDARPPASPPPGGQGTRDHTETRARGHEPSPRAGHR